MRMGPRPLQPAPMRVLRGVNMPAALIELAYLSNPAQAKEAAGPDFQASAAQALNSALSGGVLAGLATIASGPPNL